jgi:hypothetical protein
MQHFSHIWSWFDRQRNLEIEFARLETVREEGLRAVDNLPPLRIYAMYMLCRTTCAAGNFSVTFPLSDATSGASWGRLYDISSQWRK